MADISRVALFGKLNSLCYRAIESSTVFCKLRGNPYVELVHWLQQILQLTDSDLLRLIRHYGIDPAVLARDVTAALDRLPRGSTSVTDLSSQVEEAVERAWVYATLMFGESQVRSGHLLLALLKTPSLRNGLYGVSRLASAQTTTQGTPVSWSLRVSKPQSSEFLDSPRIAVVPNGDLISSYANARWSDPTPAW